MEENSKTLIFSPEKTQTPRSPQKKNLTVITKTGISANQKLNFNKNLDNLTPRSKALFFSLCKSPKKLVEKPLKTEEFPSQKPLKTMNKAESLRDSNTPQKAQLITSSSQDFSETLQKQVILQKLTVKEISDVIRSDINTSLVEGKTLTKTYMKDLNKYDTLLKVKINGKSPRTRQSLTNLSYDPDNFYYFSFEELYNANMGRIGNVRKYMEYLSGKSAEFLSVIHEKNRLMRLERDLNKKFINENIISKNFTDSIFHVNSNKLTEKQMEKLYYNYYSSPVDRKRLNASQKEFDRKLQENREKFIHYQKKLNFVVNTIENQENLQKNYTEASEENMKRIERNKGKKVEEKRKKAEEFIEKIKEKQEKQKKKERDLQKELEKKAEVLYEKITVEKHEKNQKELQKFFEDGLKDQKKDRDFSLSKNSQNLKNTQKSFENIVISLETLERKTFETSSRKTEKMNEIREKLRISDKNAFLKINRVKTLQDDHENEYLVSFLDKYQKKYQRSLSKKSTGNHERSLSAKKTRNLAFESQKFNVEKVEKREKNQKNDLMRKLGKIEEKVEISAGLRKKKIQNKVEKDLFIEKRVKENQDVENSTNLVFKSVILKNLVKVEERNQLKMRQSIVIQDGIREGYMEASQFKEELWNKSL